jgi:hypothetical protein
VSAFRRLMGFAGAALLCLLSACSQNVGSDALCFGANTRCGDPQAVDEEEYTPNGSDLTGPALDLSLPPLTVSETINEQFFTTSRLSAAFDLHQRLWRVEESGTEIGVYARDGSLVARGGNHAELHRARLVRVGEDFAELMHDDVYEHVLVRATLKADALELEERLRFESPIDAEAYSVDREGLTVAGRIYSTPVLMRVDMRGRLVFLQSAFDSATGYENRGDALGDADASYLFWQVGGYQLAYRPNAAGIRRVELDEHGNVIRSWFSSDDPGGIGSYAYLPLGSDRSVLVSEHADGLRVQVAGDVTFFPRATNAAPRVAAATVSPAGVVYVATQTADAQRKPVSVVCRLFEVAACFVATRDLDIRLLAVNAQDEIVFASASGIGSIVLP